MKRALCLAILLPLIALAGGKADLLKVRTVWNDGQYAGNTAPVYAAQRVLPRVSTGGTDFQGRIDTVGGTTYDWQVNGPCDQYIYCDPTFGVHVTWMFSAQTSGHTDRTMYYNFYDFVGQQWNFIDPTNFMNSGVNVFTIRSGFGMLDVNPITGVAYVCSHVAPSSINPTVARDRAPGGGLFEECPGIPNVTGGWPSMNLTLSEKVHVVLSDDSLEYSSVDPWCTWSAPVALAGGTFPTYIARGSKTSGRVVVTWELDNPSGLGEGWYRQSADNGITWDPAVQIPIPPAFAPGSETTASFCIAGIYPLLDNDDNLHVVASVMPMIGGTGYVMPTEIWHWYQPNGLWSKIARHECDTTHLMGWVGYNSLFAGRPTLCQCGADGFVCVWETFDSVNVEPRTGLLRADIYAARSVDDGATWGPYERLTTPDSTSKRFPSIATRALNDTFFVRYEDDLCAGFGIAPYAQGPITSNPIIVQRLKFIWGPSVTDGGTRNPAAMALALSPNPVRKNSRISYDLPKSGNVRLSVCDATGRTVRMLVNETKGPGRYSTGWDGRNGSGMLLPAGIYFSRLEAGTERLTRKLVIAR
jgi:hypothetical protein